MCGSSLNISRMLKTKSPSNDPHDVIIQNGHTDILEVVESTSENPGESNQELVVNGTSIVQKSSNFGAKPKLKQQSESAVSLPQISSSTSSQNNSSSINHVTDTFSELSVKSDCEKNSSSDDIVGHQEVGYIVYENELQMPCIMRLIQKDLSEPYSIYTYRYFIHNWPHLCFMAQVNGECVGAIVCKLDYHKKIVKRGYIAMLAVDSGHRKRKIGSTLVKRAIDAMIAEDADEVVLETEITNKPALRLYENLGFVRDKRLFRYYLNGVDALRLKLWLR